MFIIGRIAIASLPASSVTTHGRFDQRYVPRIALCGWLMIGVPWNVPKPPGFVSVKVPPCTSSGVSFFVRRALGQVGDAARDAEQVHALDVLQHRHDQPPAALERDGDAEVDEALGHDRRAAELGVHPRPVADRSTVARATNDRYVGLTPYESW